MNIPRAIEIALSEVIRKYAELGEGVTIRAWQSLAADGSWLEGTDRAFPVIDVRCSPPRTDNNQATLAVECAILMGTKTDDDKNHAIISAMYEAVQGVLDTMYVQFRSGNFTWAEIAYFLARVEAESSATAFQFGGLTFGDGLAPVDEDGINMIGITLTVHYSRSDF
jgi:hypothetical protein